MAAAPPGVDAVSSAPTLDAFLKSTPQPVNSNTAWGAGYALELRGVVLEHASQAPRSLQVHLGPSEIGIACDRQVAGKLAGLVPTNHVADPWASIVGTAIHAWLADAFMANNVRHGDRWLVEFKVVPHPEHSGTGDLYDFRHQSVVDHKALGDTSMTKLKTKGPPIHYQVQLLLYALGFRKLGLPVGRIVLVAWPRTKSSLDTMYVWEKLITAEEDRLLTEVFDRLSVRKVYAAAIKAGQMRFRDVPAEPDDDTCFWCPFWRPETDQGTSDIGCPGPQRLRLTSVGHS